VINEIRMRLLFELSGENPTLPLAELDCIGKVTDHRLQVAVVEVPDPKEAQRLAMTQVISEYLGECEPTIPAFRSLLKDLGIETDESFAGRVKKVHGGCFNKNTCSQREFEKLIGTMISGPVSLDRPAIVYRAILSEDRCYFGKVIVTIDRGTYDFRNPGKRTFFHPGVMMPRMARTLINLTCSHKGDLVLDPFSGTGGILIEAGLLGMQTLGTDFDPVMVRGSLQNIAQADLMVSDATHLPFKNQVMDAVVTDFPYGQSVCIKKTDSMENLYTDSLEEIHRVLKAGNRAVVVTHKDISEIVPPTMTILQHHEQRVHKSLTRRVLVLTH
jgi:tRNA (guanine10-N2)-dimethyltransferase